MRTALFVVASVFMIGACSGGAPPPRPSASTPSAHSPSTSAPRTGPLLTGAGVLPGETPPVEPEIARTQTDAGALAFAMYYEHALDWSLATSDSILLKQITSPGCAACDRYINNLNDLQRRNGHVVGGRISVGKVSIAEGHSLVKADVVIKVECSQTPTAVVVPSKVPSAQSTTSQRTTSFIYMSWRGSRWTVVGDFGP